MTFSNIRTVIEETKTAAFEFAEQGGFSKQQAISFAILAIHEKGICISTALEQVCGKEALGLISDVAYTKEDLVDAVRSSFFDGYPA